MVRLNRVLALVVSMVLIQAVSARAELTIITPDLAGKARTMADAAKSAHPTSPSDAASAFIASFNGEFGDIAPVDLRVVDTPQLRVQMLTPLMMVRNMLTVALARLMPLPDVGSLTNLDHVIVNVEPLQRGAPDVSRVVFFRGTKQIEPIKSGLEPRAFKNAFGAEFTIHAGSVEFGSDALQAGADDLRVVLLTNGAPIEWKLSPADVTKVR